MARDPSAWRLTLRLEHPATGLTHEMGGDLPADIFTAPAAAAEVRDGLVTPREGETAFAMAKRLMQPATLRRELLGKAAAELARMLADYLDGKAGLSPAARSILAQLEGAQIRVNKH